MNNQQKDELRRSVKQMSERGCTLNEIIKELEFEGFTKSTIKKYYKVFCKTPVSSPTLKRGVSTGAK